MPGPMKVLVGGVPALDGGDLSWSLTAGTSPHVGHFNIAREHLTAILAKGRNPISITIGDGFEEVEIQNLYVTGHVPGPNPEIATISVADQRIWWRYRHIVRRLNIRRRVGVKRVTAEGTRETIPVPEDVWYAPFSLQEGEEPWDAMTALRNVLDELVAHDPARALGRHTGVTMDSQSIKTVPMENVEIDDDGASAVKRLLARIPSAGITITRAGAILIFDQAGGRENELFGDGEKSLPEIKGTGHVEMISKSLIRPAKIEVLFQREFDVRCDFEELAQGGTASDGEDDPFTDNVAPVPDYNLTIRNQEYARGTYVKITDLLAAWGNLPGFGPLTISDLRKASVPFVDLWSMARLHGSYDPNNDWASRLSTLQTHYRRTFRLNPRFMDRLLSLSAYRVSMVDPETGTRAPSVVYSDYAVLPSMRMLLAQAGGDGDLSFIVNVEGWAETIGNNARPAPAAVSIVDMDQGIVRFDWRIDPSRTYEQILPGHVRFEGGGGSPGTRPQIPGPTMDLTDRTRSIGFNMVTDTKSLPELAAPYKASTVLSAMPGSPNHGGQFHVIEVTPQQVKALLPLNLEMGLDDATGPTMQIKVDASMETARVLWTDDDRETILRVLGVNQYATDPEILKGQQETDSAALRELTVNLDSDTGGGDLNEVALAVAAVYYARVADRMVGKTMTILQPKENVSGRIRDLTHGASGGVIGSTFSLVDSDFENLSIFALLPESTRRILMRLANPGRAQ